MNVVRWSRWSLWVLGWLASSQVAMAQRELKDIPIPDAEEERKTFVLPEGFEVNLFAADPGIHKPIQMNFDPQGRLWIAASEVYPQIAPGQKATDKILILEDTNGDGVSDKTTVFADGPLTDILDFTMKERLGEVARKVGFVRCAINVSTAGPACDSTPAGPAGADSLLTRKKLLKVAIGNTCRSLDRRLSQPTLRVVTKVAVVTAFHSTPSAAPSE